MLSPKQPDRGSVADPIQRYGVLTLALIEAIQNSRDEDFVSLMSERETVLLQIEAMTSFTAEARKELTYAVSLDAQLDDALRAKQEQNVGDLVDLYRGKNVAKVYQSSGRSDEPGFRQAS